MNLFRPQRVKKQGMVNYLLFETIKIQLNVTAPLNKGPTVIVWVETTHSSKLSRQFQIPKLKTINRRMKCLTPDWKKLGAQTFWELIVNKYNWWKVLSAVTSLRKVRHRWNFFTKAVFCWKCANRWCFKQLSINTLARTFHAVFLPKWLYWHS